MSLQIERDEAIAAHFTMAAPWVDSYERQFRARNAEAAERDKRWLSRYIKTLPPESLEMWNRFATVSGECRRQVQDWQKSARSGKTPTWPASLVPWCEDGEPGTTGSYELIMPKIIRGVLRPWITYRRLIAEKNSYLRSLWLAQLSPFERALLNHLIATVTPYHHHGLFI